MWCSNCGKDDHLIGRCPAPIKQQELAKYSKTCPGCLERDIKIEELKLSNTPVFDRKEYMRNYMKQRRAEEKNK